MWQCTPGQGQSGTHISGSRSTSLKECKESCTQFNGCIGVDYTEEVDAVLQSCRVYGPNIPRTDPGGNNRTYCTLGNNSM